MRRTKESVKRDLEMVNNQLNNNMELLETSQARTKMIIESRNLLFDKKAELLIELLPLPKRSIF